jgi:thiosulfate reductase cytochrome b subunit
MRHHLRRNLIPTRAELGEISRVVGEHVRLQFPRGNAARRYNVLQQLTYLSILFVVVPLMIFTGLTMSPTMDAGFSFLLTLFGGRQTARTIHFLCAILIVVFIVVHVLMVLASGVWNNIRSMLTGWYAIEEETRSDD